MDLAGNKSKGGKQQRHTVAALKDGWADKRRGEMEADDPLNKTPKWS